MRRRESRAGIVKNYYSSSDFLRDKYSGKTRLDLNNLLNRRKQEDKHAKKLNLIIISGISCVVVTVFLILSL